MQGIRIYEMPDCRMVSSGTGQFGGEKLDGFAVWFSSLPQSIFPKDYLFWNGEGFEWLYLYEEGMDVPAGYKIVPFKGGLYAVATDIDQQTDMDAMAAEVDRFLAANGLERDPERPQLGNIITSPAAREILGYEQMDYYVPVRAQEGKGNNGNG